MANGLSTRVSGAVSRPRNGLAVFCARFTPFREYMAPLKKGLSPCASAWGTQPMNHTDWMKSASTLNALVEMSGTTRQSATIPRMKYVPTTATEVHALA